MTRALGILHMAISGVLTLLCALIALTLWVGSPDHEDAGVALFVFAVLAFSYIIPGFVAGLGLVLGKRWARGLMFIFSLILLFAFPLGTLLGGYSLWVLLTDTPEPSIPLGLQTAGLRSNAPTAP